MSSYSNTLFCLWKEVYHVKDNNSRKGCTRTFFSTVPYRGDATKRVDDTHQGDVL